MKIFFNLFSTAWQRLVAAEDIGGHPLQARTDEHEPGTWEGFEARNFDIDEEFCHWFAERLKPYLNPEPPPPTGWETCGSTIGVDLVTCVHKVVNPAHTPEGAFEVTKRVAWLLRDQGFGLLHKGGGENIVQWHGVWCSASRICKQDGHLYKLLRDVPTSNEPSWQNEGIDSNVFGNWVAPIDPRT